MGVRGSACMPTFLNGNEGIGERSCIASVNATKHKAAYCSYPL